MEFLDHFSVLDAVALASLALGATVVGLRIEARRPD